MFHEGSAGVSVAQASLLTAPWLAVLLAAVIVATAALRAVAPAGSDIRGIGLIIAGNLALALGVGPIIKTSAVAVFFGLAQLVGYMLIAGGFATMAGRYAPYRVLMVMALVWVLGDLAMDAGGVAPLPRCLWWCFISAGFSLAAARRASQLIDTDGNIAHGHRIQLWLILNAAVLIVLGLGRLAGLPNEVAAPAESGLMLLFAVMWTLAIIRHVAWLRERLVESYGARLRNELLLDPMTGAINRPAVLEEVERGYALWRRHRRALSLVGIDLDHFASFNDVHGRAIGDKMLRAVVDACRRHLRAEDLVGRVGGEEFLILFPETDHAGAVLTAQRLLRVIGEIGVPVGSHHASVTASVGVATLTHTDTSIAAALERVNRGIAHARSRGGNLVIGVAADGSMVNGAAVGDTMIAGPATG